jgi:predicted AlkP superfamily phosphohydrolase/phosphomutase
MGNRVIVLEFNELTPALVDRFIAQGHLPNFARLRAESIVAVTDAEETFPTLEPWIQWVTVHTGLPYAKHKVYDLGDGPRLAEPRIWDLASKAGRSVWVCGSMNAAVQGDTINGFVMPDPWAIDVKSYPRGLFDPYLDLVRTYVQEYTTAKPKVSKAAFARFGRFMLANGLSVKTVTDTIRQLVDERRNPSHWRRAAILDRLQWDVFAKFYKAHRPGLATFFLNSTAHYQHYFWRNMDPDAFAVKSDAETQRKYGDAILFGYRKMDELIGECFDLADENTSIVLCTALSQQPMLLHEHTGGKQIFKPRDQAKLFAFAGVTSRYEYAPVMAEQFHLIFESEADAEEALVKIKALRLDKGPDVLMLARREGDRIFSGCRLEANPPEGARVLSSASNEAVPFDDLFYPVEAVRSGMHHPDGLLWIRRPDRGHKTIDRKVSLLEIAPTLLELMAVKTDHRFEATVMPELSEELISQSIAA